MKLKYEDFAFKTNRNSLVIKKFDVGVTVPENIKNKMKKIEIVKINLPDKLHHISEKPISSFKNDRIFYVSYDEFQSIAHGLLLTKDEIHPFSDKKLYFYTLKPIQKKIKVILFNKNKRPKEVSNSLGIKYDTFTKSGQFKLGLFPNRLNKSNYEEQNFLEGSGDNMLLGQILCNNLNMSNIM